MVIFIIYWWTGGFISSSDWGTLQIDIEEPILDIKPKAQFKKGETLPYLDQFIP